MATPDSPLTEYIEQESLWETVERLTSENIVERSEIKKVIGESLIDETLDLHLELNSLKEIWIDFNRDNVISGTYIPLPDPPFLRENLEKQITLLVDLLQQKLSIRDGKQEGFTAFLSNEEREIVKSISRENSSSKIRKIPASDHSTANIVDTTAIKPRVSSATKTQTDDVNVFGIDKLTDTLQQEFENERQELISSIEKVQAALLNGSDERDTNSRQSSPTIKELQTLNNKLEKTVLSPHKPPQRNPQISRQSKWSNNFQKSPVAVKLSPSPPSSANTSTYKHPHLLSGTHTSRKLANLTTVAL